MSVLSDTVLPLIRTRADVWRWNIADEHGARMHEAVEILRRAAEGDDPTEVFAVTQRATASALKVIMRADDSSGIIGDACRDLLDLHPIVAAPARVAARKLVDWMLKFQFANECDYFTIDPVAYAPALGVDGMAAYRTKLDELAATLGPAAGRRRPLDVTALRRMVDPRLECPAPGGFRSGCRRHRPHARPRWACGGMAGGDRSRAHGDR